ncbi:MAG: hypothetical protein HAW58_04670 [Candidatus Thioglobus sp.]|nr:hypothetical protein [Candidatus Thioglobus sp.]
MDDKDIQKESLKHQTIRLSVVADCPYYNTSVIITKDYAVSTDIVDENHHFNTGNSLSISS